MTREEAQGLKPGDILQYREKFLLVMAVRTGQYVRVATGPFFGGDPSVVSWRSLLSRVDVVSLVLPANVEVQR